MPVSVQFVLPSPGKVIFEIRLDRSVAEINRSSWGHSVRICQIRFGLFDGALESPKATIDTITYCYTTE